MDPDFSDAFCEFLKQSIPTLNAAEVLLFLHKNRDNSWSIAQIVAEIESVASLSDQDAAKYIETFRYRGLVVRANERMQYEPISPDVNGHVSTLAKLYNERPVTLIRVIYALSDKKIETFADAFKIWGK